MPCLHPCARHRFRQQALGGIASLCASACMCMNIVTGSTCGHGTVPGADGGGYCIPSPRDAGQLTISHLSRAYVRQPLLPLNIPNNNRQTFTAVSSCCLPLYLGTCHFYHVRRLAYARLLRHAAFRRIFLFVAESVTSGHLPSNSACLLSSEQQLLLPSCLVFMDRKCHLVL